VGRRCQEISMIVPEMNLKTQALARVAF